MAQIEWWHMVSDIYDNIESGNGLFTFWHQAITWTSVDLLSMKTEMYLRTIALEGSGIN